jgi:hypothetical protein
MGSLRCVRGRLQSEEITLPVTLIIHLVVFGAVPAAGVPLLLALSSIAASIGLSAVFSHLVPDAGEGAEVIILMGMAVGRLLAVLPQGCSTSSGSGRSADGLAAHSTTPSRYGWPQRLPAGLSLCRP